MADELMEMAASSSSSDGDMFSAPSVEALEMDYEHIDRSSFAPFVRKSHTFTSHSDRFRLRAKTFNHQFSHIYLARLVKLRVHLEATATAKWQAHIANNDAKLVQKVLELQQGELSIIFGTLYKEMQLKPNILEEYGKEKVVVPAETRHKFTSADDSLILEDESGRVNLTGPNVPVGEYVTGTVIAILGKEKQGGDFEVDDFCWLDLGPQQPLPAVAEEEDKYVALVSGFGFGSSSAKPMACSLFSDFVTGNLGGPEEHARASRIVRVVVAGGSICPPENREEAPDVRAPMGAKTQSALAAPLREFDLLATQLASSVHLHLLPGASDPTNYNFPQQPLKRVLFRGLPALAASVHMATNPDEFEVDGVRFLGTSGQNVDDVRKYSEVDDALRIMEEHLRARVLAPTAPDTLSSYPFTDSDPYVIDACPHVYFVGNQPTYATKEITGPQGQRVCLVSLPRFDASGMAVLLNLRTLQCEPMVFE